MIPCMDVYKTKIQSNGSHDNLNLIIVVKGNFHLKEMIGKTWSLTASMGTLKYFLKEYFNHKARVNQLDCIGAFLQDNINHRVL